MVKMFAGFVLSNLVALLELVGALIVTVAIGLRFGSFGVLLAVGVFLLAKSFELDLKAKP